MAVDISALVTANFPRTEAELSADTNIDYVSLKASATARAKADAYGASTPPAEASIPDQVARWVADKATLYLIPVAREVFALDRYLAQTNPQGEQRTRYDLLEVLQRLQDELERACADGWKVVEALVGSSVTPTDEPEVSHTGPMIDSTARALLRGVPV